LNFAKSSQHRSDFGRLQRCHIRPNHTFFRRSGRAVAGSTIPQSVRDHCDCQTQKRQRHREKKKPRQTSPEKTHGILTLMAQTI
jgi:hypothetical protein